MEAARLGCRSFGNDINPVAHIIQKGSLEFPQKYGKPITYSKTEFIKIYGEEAFKNLPTEWKNIEAGEIKTLRIPNRISFDFNLFSSKILNTSHKKLTGLFPSNNGVTPVAYYWSRVGTCSNPSCKAEIPLLKQFYLLNTEQRKVYLKPIITENRIEFQIALGVCNEEGWIKSRKLLCPCCGGATDSDNLKSQSIKGLFKIKLLAVIEESKDGRVFRLPNDSEAKIAENVKSNLTINEEIVKGDSRSLWLTLWGLNTWGEMFTQSQLKVLETLLFNLNEVKLQFKQFFNNDYRNALATYLAIWIDRIAARMTSFGLIDTTNGAKINDPFGRQGIAYVFDFPEVNPFEMDQSSWISRVIES
ncbi:MAG: hypothetical protein ACK5WV_00865 [Chryseotalea sp.]